jgi:hypothetical protein
MRCVSLDVRANVVLEFRSVVAVVMEVQLDLAQAGPSEAAERRQIVRGILLSRKEKRVPRRPAVRVPKLVRENGIFSFPTGDAISTLRGSRSSPERLVVVAHRKEHVFRAHCTSRGEILERVQAEARNPATVLLVRESERSHV